MSKKYFYILKKDKIEITKEINCELERIQRRNKYIQFLDKKNGKVSLDILEDNIVATADDFEETIIDKLLLEKLSQCLKLLSSNDMFLIEQLFFINRSERELSKFTGIPQKTINNRKLKLLKKLKKMLMN